MIADKKKFYGGMAMFIGFIVVLVFVFAPIFNGENALEYLDSLYNSISKGSAYYIPKVKEESDKFIGNSVNVSLKIGGKDQAQETALLFEAGGAKVIVEDTGLKVIGDLGKILENCLADADAMYENRGDKVSQKYGYDERRVLFNWWRAFNETDQALKNQKRFKEASAVSLVNQKAVEASYNYYKIEPQNITDKLGVVILSLVFYVIYTLWYGFAIMFMFEGCGMRLEH
jgi:hypothetical protein